MREFQINTSEAINIVTLRKEQLQESRFQNKKKNCQTAERRRIKIKNEKNKNKNRV
jgi:hypothetical protein